MKAIESWSEMKQITNKNVEEISALIVMPCLNILQMIDEEIDPFNTLQADEYILKQYQYTLKLLDKFNK